MKSIDPSSIITNLVPAWRASEITNLIFLKGGYSNENYQFRYGTDLFVVKVGGSSGAISHSEARYLELTIAPDVIAMDRPNGHLITRWIPGDLLDLKYLHPRDAGKYLRDLHLNIPKGITRYDPMYYIRKNIRKSGSISKKIIDIWHSLSWTASHTVGCHNDLNPMNIIRSGASWRTLDWETAGDNDPIFDFVGFAYGLGYDDNSFTSFLSEYFTQNSDPPSNSRLLATRLVFQMREHTWALSQLRMGNDRPEISNQVITSERELIRLSEKL